MYRRYMVYIDDGENVYKVAIAAISEDAARAWCVGNGEVIAIKDVTNDITIKTDRVIKALSDADFDKFEVGFICRALEEFGITE